MKKIILKPSVEKNILKKNHWIFSGAILEMPDIEAGSMLPVFSHSNQMLGWAYFNPKCSLIGHMVSFNDTDPYLAIKENIKNSIYLRKSLFNSSTNAYRLINSEGDKLPGLIVDRYDDLLVMQIGTLGIEKLKFFIIEELKKNLPEIKSIYEKSNLSSRALEGLSEFEDFIWGDKCSTVTILENGIKFKIDPIHGQKSGFFLDQRSMRELIGKYSKGKRVCNFFSYSGGFSIYAALNGAKVDSIDISSKAIEWAKQNFEINDLISSNYGFFIEDSYSFIQKNSLEYDLIILDPPAFAKKRQDVTNAQRGYENLNRSVLNKIPAKSFLLTCSCSRYIDSQMFDRIIYRAAQKSNREVFILSRHLQAPDHTININHLEAEYLKSLLLFVK